MHTCRADESKNIVEVCSEHLHATPVPPGERRGEPVPGDLEALILNCLAKTPADRPQSARALSVSLRACDAPWTEADAADWWANFGPQLRDREGRPKESTGDTLAIDLARWAS